MSTMPDDINGPYTEVPAQPGEFKTVYLSGPDLTVERVVKYAGFSYQPVGELKPVVPSDIQYQPACHEVVECASYDWVTKFPPLTRLRLVTVTLEASGWLTKGSKS